MTNKQVPKTQELKYLTTRKTLKLQELEQLKKEKQEVYKKELELREQLGKIDTEIKKLKKKDLIISEHAILRYLERVSGIPLDTVKNAILSDNDKSILKESGVNGRFWLKTHGIIVRDGVVVSVYVDPNQKY